MNIYTGNVWRIAQMIGPRSPAGPADGTRTPFLSDP